MEVSVGQENRVRGRGMRGRSQALATQTSFGAAGGRWSRVPMTSAFGNADGGNMALLAEEEGSRRAAAPIVHERTKVNRMIAPSAQTVVSPTNDFRFDVDELEFVLATTNSQSKPKTPLNEQLARNLELERELGCSLTRVVAPIARSHADAASETTSGASSYLTASSLPPSPSLYDNLATDLVSLSLTDELSKNDKNEANRTVADSRGPPSEIKFVGAPDSVQTADVKDSLKTAAVREDKVAFTEKNRGAARQSYCITTPVRGGYAESSRSVRANDVSDYYGITVGGGAAASVEEGAVDKRDVACGDDTPIPTVAQLRAELVARLRAQDEADDRARFEETVLCKVCMTVRYNTMVLPCCHLWGCEGCVKIVNECAICRKPIEDRLRLTTVDELTELQKHTVRDNMRRMINENRQLFY
uniref:RING-type domain-containing protein n=1 Tax=Plectus sambesii TaxID=2011161 RepID=A0A914WFW4_9BILA